MAGLYEAVQGARSTADAMTKRDFQNPSTKKKGKGKKSKKPQNFKRDGKWFHRMPDGSVRKGKCKPGDRY